VPSAREPKTGPSSILYTILGEKSKEKQKSKGKKQNYNAKVRKRCFVDFFCGIFIDASSPKGIIGAANRDSGYLILDA
jgi:hypothetical protein